jgi:hypothetical protein
MKLMKTLFIVIAIYGFLLGSLPAHAKIYKWVDENGKAHFTDDPTRLPQQEDSKIETLRELPPPLVKKKQPSPDKGEPLRPELEGDPTRIDKPLKQKPAQKKEEPAKSLAQKKESYEKILQESRETWNQKKKQIEKMEMSGEKPKDWHTKESLDQIIERYKKHMETEEKKIKKYQKKINSLLLSD